MKENGAKVITGHRLAIAYIMQKSGEVNGTEIDGRFESGVGVGVDMMCHGDDTLDVVPGMRGIVILHIRFDMSCDGLDQGVVRKRVYRGWD